MIARLHGQLIYKQPPALMIDVQGVGYELEAPMSTFYQLPACGQAVTLHIHMAVREDAQTLYGFHDLAERKLFRMLLKVNGVGAKMALTILSGMDACGFRNCIQHGDTHALVRLPGVGKRTADRLVIELRDRLHDDSGDDAAAKAAGAGQPALHSYIEEAVSALIALGYKGPEAARMVDSVKAEASSCEDLIRLALKSSLNA